MGAEGIALHKPGVCQAKDTKHNNNNNNNSNNNNNLIFILRKIQVNMIKCTLHESKLSTLISYPK